MPDCHIYDFAVLHTEIDFKIAISHILKYSSIEFHIITTVSQTIKCNKYCYALNIVVLHSTYNQSSVHKLSIIYKVPATHNMV